MRAMGQRLAGDLQQTAWMLALLWLLLWTGCVVFGRTDEPPEDRSSAGRTCDVEPDPDPSDPPSSAAAPASDLDLRSRPVGGFAPAPSTGQAAAAVRRPVTHAGVARGSGDETLAQRMSAADAATDAMLAAGATHVLPSASIDREVFVTSLRMVTR